MRYIAASELVFHEGQSIRVVAAGAELRWLPDDTLSDRDHDHLQRYRGSRRKWGDDSIVLAFALGTAPDDRDDRPRWLRVPAEARPVVGTAAPAPVRDTGGGRARSVRR